MLIILQELKFNTITILIASFIVFSKGQLNDDFSFTENVDLKNLKALNDELTIMLLSAVSENTSVSRKNIIVSPSSFLTGIGMLYRGMDGNTRTHIGNIVGFPRKNKPFRDLFKILTEKREDLERNPKYVANMIMVATDNKIKTTYAEDVKNVFNGNPYHEDFKKDSMKTQKNINTWISQETNRGINNLFPTGSITANTTICLVNALYFSDNWKDDPFQSEPYYDTFKLSNRKDIQAKFMVSEYINIGYRNLQDAEIISLPLANDDYFMVVVVPNKISDPKKMMNMMRGKSGFAIMNHVTSPKLSLNFKRVQLTMPMFKTHFGINLGNILSSIGLSEIISPDANYRKLAQVPVNLDAIYHKAVINVTTNGVEVPAKSQRNADSVSFYQANQKVNIDRPFLYFIVENSKKIVHLAGILLDPTEEMDDE